jgi:hypothetical protein
MTVVTTLIGFRNVRDPRALARILEEAEAKLAAKLHPDPYISTFELTHWRSFLRVPIPAASFPGGTKW